MGEPADSFQFNGIGRCHFVGGESVRSIARDLQLSRPTVRKALTALEQPVYRRRCQACPKLGISRPSWNSGWTSSPACRGGRGGRPGACARGCRPRATGVINCSL